MSRLFTAKTGSPEIAAQFGVADAPIIPMPNEMVEGDQGVIVIERNGSREFKMAQWGFPRRTRESRLSGEAPGIIGLVADLTNPMWEHVVVEPAARCLIPFTHFANPAGEKGTKTRSWFSLKDQAIMAWAGFWNETETYGPVFAGMTMAANDAVMPFNDRMPVLLGPDEYSRWLHGGIEDVIGFQFIRPSPAAARIAVLHTEDLWRSGKVPDFAAKSQMALL